MNVVPGMGVNLQYLKAGRAQAQKLLGNAYREVDHPANEEDISTFVNRIYEAMGLRFQGYYARCVEAFMWRYGQQSVQLNPHSWLFETVPFDRRIPRPNLNLLGDKVESVTGEILKATPRGTFMPKDNSPHNRRFAQIARGTIAIKDEDDKIDNVLRMAAETAVICGDAYIEVVIDNSNARTVEIPAYATVDLGGGMTDTAPQMDGNGEPIMETMKLADERCNLITPLMQMHNYSATSLEDSSVIVNHVGRSLEWARAQWPEQAEKIQPASSYTQVGQFQQRIHNLIQYEASSAGMAISPYGAAGGELDEEQALVITVRMNADAYYPKGRYFIIAGGRCVVADELPLGKLCLVHYRYSPVPNSMLSVGLAKDVIGVNRWIIQMAHQIGMQRRTLGVPFVMAPVGSGGAFTGGDLPMKYGAVYTYKPHANGQKPEVIYPHGTMDAGTQSEMELWLNDFLERIPGTRAVMQGERPQGVYSGVMLRQMLASASVRFQPKMAAFHKFVEQLYSIRMEAIAKAPAGMIPRRVGYPSSASPKLWMEFAASDMGDNVTYKIETISAAQLDEATRIQDQYELIKLGVLNPMDPKVQTTFLRQLGLTDLLNEMSPDVVKADDENARIAAGEEVHIGPYENDAIHLRVHTDWINSMDFMMMPPEAQQATILHNYEHEERIAVKQAAAMMSGIPPNGMPSLTGSPVEAMAGGAPAQLTPGNGVPGLPQTSVAAQQAPAEAA